jgi:lysozyme family protein
MATFEKAIAKVLRNEGGYVNDPSDPGGETYKGISRKNFGKWDGWTNIDAKKKNGNFPSNLESDLELQEKVNHFYETEFWNKVGGANIVDEDIAFAIFDFAVNAGTGVSKVIAQKVLDLEPDGIFGKETLKKLNEVDKEKFIAMFTLGKIARYVSIAEKNKALKKYIFGWVKRALNN